MGPKQLRVFSLYMQLGPDRSLSKAAGACKEHGFPIAVATLKRYSARYAWQARLKRLDAMAEERTLDQLRESLVTRLEQDLQAIASAKQRFYRRVQLDPEDPNLSKRDRKRVVDPNLKDFERLLALEQQLVRSRNKLKGQSEDRQLFRGSD